MVRLGIDGVLRGIVGRILPRCARAYQIAPPQIIATFDYAYLVSAAIWGFVFFAERPDALTLLGMALITIAGLLAAERKTKPVTTRETS